jgi:glutathione S-transferase
MSIEVYWGCGSPYSWRVLLALEIKRMPYKSVRLSFSEKDLKSDRFLAINPRGQVPAIREGGFTLYESIAILCYLEARQPEPALFGRSAAEQGRIWRSIMECVCYWEPHMTHFAGAVFSGELPEKREEAVWSRRTVEQEMSRLNDELIYTDFLAGRSRVSAADVAYYPVVQLLTIAAKRENTEEIGGTLRRIEKYYPAVQAWCKRMEAIPGFERTDPPHWRS